MEDMHTTPATAPTTAPTSNARRSFLGYAGLFGAGLALVSCAPSMGMSGGMGNTMGAGAAQDLEILNYALTLEYLEAEFYTAFSTGALAAKLTNPRTKEYAKELASHEQAHVEALAATIRKLGGTPVSKPTFDFSPLIGNGSGQNDMTFLQLAATIEPVGVRAYLGQVARLSNPELITAAAAIHAVEANHVSGVQELRVSLGYNKNPTRQTSIAPQTDANPGSTNVADFNADYSPTPTAFWAPLTMAQVLAIVGPVIKK
ncbi:ferritin-like domain-containing protein [Deinococcus puniceus]|uniref:ferritin-like domain-containing protein n=1 Tax=Deinococcus puniceus TaxID=1182568 RepID=UPI0007C92DD3|nr:ferritin-like domain-containing protein [Deinococcus puniceus]